MKNIISTTLISILCFTQLSSQTWREYNNEIFNISYPSNWSFDNSGINGTEAFISSELEGISDLFSENVNLIVQDLSNQNIEMSEYITLTRNQLSQLNATNIKISKIENTKYGPESNLEYEYKYDILSLKTKQRVIIHKEKAYVITYSATVSDFDKYQTIADRILSSFNFETSNYKSTRDSNIYENLKHKLSIKNLIGFEDINEGGNYLLHMGNLSDLNYRSYSIKYSDDWSFRLMTMEDYSKEVTEDQFINALKVLYKDLSINIFKKSYPKTLSEDVFHLVYSGTEIETNDRMTVAVFQYIKNSKLYTLNCQCKSTYWQYYYNDCLDLLSSLKIE